MEATVYYEVWGIEPEEKLEDGIYLVHKYPVANFDSEKEAEEYAWEQAFDANLTHPEVRRVEE